MLKKAAILTSALLMQINISHATTMVDLPKWQTISTKESLSFRGSAVYQDTLWVTGSSNSVYVSFDAGKTWQDKSVKVDLTTDFRDVEVFDEQTAIVMGVGSGKQSVLYKTVNGGDSWQLLYQNEDPEGFFDSIAFWDKNNGLLLGDPVDGYYVVKRTTDGGKTWHRIEKAHLPIKLDKEAAFAASGNTLIVGKNGKAFLTTGGFSASVYHSEDFGQSWQRQSVPLYAETQTAGGYGLALNHKEQLFVLGGDYQQRPASYQNIARFIKGKWQAVDAGQRGLRTAMSCQGNLCIATGKTSSDISFNAGNSWMPLANESAKVGDKGFYTIASNKQLFLAAGANGKIATLSFRKN